MTTPITNANIGTAVTYWLNSGGTRQNATYGDISGWDVSAVTDGFAGLFLNTGFGVDASDIISEWNTISATNMNAMFRNATNISGDSANISSWNVGNVTNMSYMFRGASNFNSDISSWNVGNVTNMSYMFHSSNAFNQNISSWNTGNVTNMLGMFNLNTVFNVDISSWNTDKVTNMSQMFRDTGSFNQDISNWNTVNVTTIQSMFQSATAFNQYSIGNWNLSSVGNLNSFVYSTGLSSVEYSNLLINLSNNPTINDGLFMGGNLIRLRDIPTSLAYNTLTDPGGFNWNIADYPVQGFIQIIHMLISLVIIYLEQ